MNCNPGDLAIVVRSGAGNEGRLVEVIRFLGVAPIFDGLTWPAYPGPRWHVKSVGSPLAVRLAGAIIYVDETPFADAWLRPIRPDAEPESTETPKELEHS